MTLLTTVDPGTPSDAKAVLDGVKRKLGVIPNLMRVLATNPTVLGAYLDFSATLGGGRLGTKLHEQIALAVAEANGCNYCLAAHSLIGKGAGLTPGDILSARAGTAQDARAAAAITLARTLVAKRGTVAPGEIEQARTAGLSDGDIVEVIAAVSLNVFTNYLNLAADTDIDFPVVKPLAAAA